MWTRFSNTRLNVVFDAQKKDHLARLEKGGGSELNRQCSFKIIFSYVDVIPNESIFSLARLFPQGGLDETIS